MLDSTWRWTSCAEQQLEVASHVLHFLGCAVRTLLANAGTPGAGTQRLLPVLDAVYACGPEFHAIFGATLQHALLEYRVGLELPGVVAILGAYQRYGHSWAFRFLPGATDHGHGRCSDVLEFACAFTGGISLPHAHGALSTALVAVNMVLFGPHGVDFVAIAQA